MVANTPTDDIETFVLRLIFPEQMLADIQTEARRRNIPASMLIRNVVRDHLELIRPLRPRTIFHQPMSPHLKQHFEEDR